MSTPIYEIGSRLMPDGILCVSLTGDFDMSVAADLSGTLVRAAQAPGVSRIIVDLARVAFLDSHGIAALIAGFDAAVQSGLPFTVTNAQGMVRQVLDITGLSEVLMPDQRGWSAG